MKLLLEGYCDVGCLIWLLLDSLGVSEEHTKCRSSAKLYQNHVGLGPWSIITEA